MRRFLKFLHTISSLGFAGGLAALMVMLTVGPAAAATEEYLAFRAAIYALCNWLVLPSIAVLMFSGVLSMAVHFPFQNALWVWLKLLMGFLVLEATLASLVSPARRAVTATQEALGGQLTHVELVQRIDDKWGAMWAILIIALVNVYLGVYRPRFSGRRAAIQDAGSTRVSSS